MPQRLTWNLKFYSPVVTLCTAQWSICVPPVVIIYVTVSGNYTYRQWSIYVQKSGHYMYRHWSLNVPHSGHYMYRHWSLNVSHSGHYMYRTVVTIFTPSGHYKYHTVIAICTASLTFSKSMFAHTVCLYDMCGSEKK